MCVPTNRAVDHERQANVLSDVAEQIKQGNRSVIGFMIESNINAGNQKIPQDRSKLEYGVSVTDACVDWQKTEEMIRGLRDQVKDVLTDRQPLTQGDSLAKTG